MAIIFLTPDQLRAMMLSNGEMNIATLLHLSHSANRKLCWCTEHHTTAKAVLTSDWIQKSPIA